MKPFVTAITALLLFGASAQAQQTHVVIGDERLGGDPNFYITMSGIFRDNNVRVVVPGKCISSCTLYTSLIPHGLICARPKAVFVFHRFNILDWIKVDGQGHMTDYHVSAPLTGPAFDRIWAQYPPSVQELIEKSGGLPEWGHELVVPATDLVPVC